MKDNNVIRVSAYVTVELAVQITVDAKTAGLSTSEYLKKIIEGYYKSLEEAK